MKRFLFFLSCILCLCGYAQDSRGFVSCTVETGDSLVQGTVFMVKYVLTATNWQDVNVETNYPFIKKSIEYNTQKSKKSSLNRLIVYANIACPKTGEVVLPRLSANIGGKTYYSKAKTVYLHPHPRWAEDYEMGNQWLKEYGIDSVLLEPTLRWDELTIFNDKKHKAFVTIVAKKYRRYVDNPILAYSTESCFEINDATRTLMSNLANQVDKIYEKHGYYRPLPVAAIKVQPLLGEMAWGQNEPYNTYTPLSDTSHCPTGCVATALAQVLRYQVPTFNDGNWQPNWSDMHNSYSKEEGNEAKEVAKLMSKIGIGLGTYYGQEGSIATLQNVKGLLLFQMGCSGKMQYIQNMDDSLKVALIHTELSKQRPILANNKSHCYVIDGCDGEYLHYNLGWNGLCNGYYHTPFCATDDHTRMWDVREIVTGIQAAEEEREKSIVLKTPGELGTLLPDEEKASITKLHIAGKLNSEDVRVLRHMAGAVSSDTTWTWEGGALTYLDLQNASFVTDKTNSYEKIRLLCSASFTQFVRDDFGSTRAFQKHFDLNKPLSDKMWKDFERFIGTKESGYTITRDEAHFCYLNGNTQKGIISPYMFFLCTSLRHIELPNNVTSIEFGAFAGCSTLQTVVIGKKVSYVDSHAFSHCPFLTDISYSSKTVWCEPNFEGCPLLTDKPAITSGRRTSFRQLTWD